MTYVKNEDIYAFVDEIDRWVEYYQRRKNLTPTITNFVSDIIDYSTTMVITNRMNANNAYRRATFTQMNWCYVCNKSTQDVQQTYMDSFIGRNLLYGWTYCESCKPYIKLDKSYREKKLAVLPLSTYLHLGNINIQFWRRPSIINKPSYLHQMAQISVGGMDSILIKHKYKVLCALVMWEDEGEYLEKAIPLANLIFYNRNIFDYNYTTSVQNILEKSAYINDSKWHNKWVTLFKTEYDKANGWLEFYKIATRNNIPREIILSILDYWGMFQLGKHYTIYNEDYDY